MFLFQQHFVLGLGSCSGPCVSAVRVSVRVYQRSVFRPGCVSDPCFGPGVSAVRDSVRVSARVRHRSVFRSVLRSWCVSGPCFGPCFGPGAAAEVSAGCGRRRPIVGLCRGPGEFQWSGDCPTRSEAGTGVTSTAAAHKIRITVASVRDTSINLITREKITTVEKHAVQLGRARRPQGVVSSPSAGRHAFNLTVFSPQALSNIFIPTVLWNED